MDTRSRGNGTNHRADIRNVDSSEFDEILASLSNRDKQIGQDLDKFIRQKVMRLKPSVVPSNDLNQLQASFAFRIVFSVITWLRKRYAFLRKLARPIKRKLRQVQGLPPLEKEASRG